MQVNVHGRNIEVTADLIAHVERRLGFALVRFGRRIARVAVRLLDVNGPRGGVDKRCCVDVSLIPVGKVYMEDADADLYVAVDRAADRVGRAVGRRFEREREFDAEVARTKRRFSTWRGHLS